MRGRGYSAACSHAARPIARCTGARRQIVTHHSFERLQPAARRPDRHRHFCRQQRPWAGIADGDQPWRQQPLTLPNGGREASSRTATKSRFAPGAERDGAVADRFRRMRPAGSCPALALPDRFPEHQLTDEPHRRRAVAERLVVEKCAKEARTLLGGGAQVQPFLIAEEIVRQMRRADLQANPLAAASRSSGTRS